MQTEATVSTMGYSRREQIGWYFYDWANSTFSTTVAVVFLGPYLTTITKNAADASGYVHPLGIPVVAGSFFPYIVSLSVALQVFFLPILGAIADYSHLKKQMMGVFAYVGAFATICMYFLHGTNYMLGGALFLLANLTYGASIVFYNAFLPDIASPDDRDRVSSQGWALGYLGGGLLLLLNLILFLQRDKFGLAADTAVRICLASAGIWWAGFTVIPLIHLKVRQPLKQLPKDGSYLTIGFKQLSHTLREFPRYPHSLLFLIAYLLYNDGIQTVISLSSEFGSEELKLGQQSLIISILMVQFVAFYWRLGFWLSSKWIGSKRAIMLSLVIWTGTVYASYAWVQPNSPAQFFVLAAAIAVVLGAARR